MESTLEKIKTLLMDAQIIEEGEPLDFGVEKAIMMADEARQASENIDHHMLVDTLTADDDEKKQSIHITGEPGTWVINVDFEVPIFCAILTLDEAITLSNTLVKMVRELKEMRGG